MKQTFSHSNFQDLGAASATAALRANHLRISFLILAIRAKPHLTFAAHFTTKNITLATNQTQNEKGD